MNIEDPEPPQSDEGDRACEELPDQMKRARRVVEQYRHILPDTPPAEPEKDHRN